MKDLADQPVLLIDRSISPGAYDKTLDLYRQSGLELKIVPTQTMPYDEAGAILVDSGKGIYLAVGKNPCHPSFADRLVAIPLMGRSATMEVHIVWRTDEREMSVLEFVNFTCKVFESVPSVVDLSQDADDILGPRSGASPSDKHLKQKRIPVNNHKPNRRA